MIKPYLTVDNLTNEEVGLNVQGLRKVYKSRLALMDFNISVTRGEVVSLLGPMVREKQQHSTLLLEYINQTVVRSYWMEMKYQTFLCTEGQKQD